jgi:predicted nucleotidyltransferase
MSEDKKPREPDVKYDEEKLQKDAQEFMDKYRVKMKDISDEILGELYVNILPYIETDSWINYREALRIDLEHEYKFKKYKEPWATNLRRAIFVENRDEVSKLISEDILNRIKHLEDCKQEFEQFRYTPLGDTYRDIQSQNAALRNSLQLAVEALECGEAALAVCETTHRGKYTGESFGLREIKQALAKIKAKHGELK